MFPAVARRVMCPVKMGVVWTGEVVMSLENERYPTLGFLSIFKIVAVV